MVVCLLSYAIFFLKQINRENNFNYFGRLMLNLFLLGLITVILLTSYWIYSYCTESSTTDITIAKETLKHNDINEVQPLFDHNFTIYFRHCGRQPEFHEVVPALVSLFLLVFNLSEILDTQYKVTYKTSNNEVSAHSKTVWQPLYLTSFDLRGKTILIILTITIYTM